MSAEFYNASQARQFAIGRQTALDEIYAIQREIETRVQAGALAAVVGPGTSPTPIVTTMTSSSAYYNSWNDPSNNNTSDDIARRARMDSVIAHFNKLGYTITREQHASTSTFNWDIRW
jgi:hypothetical protein